LLQQAHGPDGLEEAQMSEQQYSDPCL